MGKDLFFMALGGKGTKRLRALSVFAVVFAAGQATQLNVPGGSYLSMHFLQGVAPCSCISHFGAFLWGRSSWLSISLCSSAVHTELVFHSKAL